MNTQPLHQLIAQGQEILSAIRQHPQYQGLQVDCDVTLGDVSQFFNALQWQATASSVDVSREGFFQ
jgi:hypothetical protein